MLLFRKLCQGPGDHLLLGSYNVSQHLVNVGNLLATLIVEVLIVAWLLWVLPLPPLNSLLVALCG